MAATPGGWSAKALLLVAMCLIVVSKGEKVQLVVGVKQNADGLRHLDELFWAVADPDHEEFGNHRSLEEISEIVASPEESVEAARQWMASLGASNVRLLPSRDALKGDWVLPKTEQAPKVPAELKKHIDFCIMERNKLPLHFNAMHTPTASVAEADSSMGLAAQKQSYQVPADLVADHPDNLQMVWGTATFGLVKSDLQNFYQAYCPTCNISKVSLDKDSTWKGKTGDNTVESMLDTEYISGMTGNVRTLVSNTNTTASTSGSTGFGIALLHFVVSDLGTRTTDLPLVLSMSLGSLSYASCERMCSLLAKQGTYTDAQCWDYLSNQQSQVCMYATEDEMSRTSTEFQKLGLRGVTITGSSGDGGSHFSFGPFQEGGIGGALDELVCDQTNAPVYPTASPYVLSIGGSQWSSNGFSSPSCSPTAPCGWSDAGGGFSWEFPTPPYQTSGNVTGEYLGRASNVQTMCKASTYNGQGRGYPDFVALAAIGIPACWSGSCSGIGGTSASAPTMAGMLSLINDARLKAGLKSLGFINTRLYKLAMDPKARAELFTDIAFDNIDSSWNCEDYSSCDGCDTGFPALSGWDAATGFGQPLFPGFLKYLGSD